MTANSSLVVSTRAYTGTLPTSVRTRGGAIFDPRAKIWTYKDGVTKVVIDFDSTAALSPEMQQSLRSVLLWYTEYSSPSHLLNMYKRFLDLVRFLAIEKSGRIDAISKIDLLNYKSSLTPDIAWYLGSLSGFLKKWHGMGYPGVAADGVALLRDLKVRGNAKGVAVLTMDPVNGPYTDLEQQGIQDALNDAFAEGRIADHAYMLAWLFMALGQRPSQFAGLKVSDITALTTEGTIFYNIRIPRAKQRNAHPRAQLNDRPLVSQIGGPLLAYAGGVRERFRDRLACPDNAPLFPCSVPGDWAPGYEYHDTAKELSRRFSLTLRALQVYSERTGDLLHITALRFQSTSKSGGRTTIDV